ncbi:FtsW/RodA/SpoVE family cell cycle protein [Culicoidibacter larvae]|uniref:Probable peptidoglycan glycosyltransferase FtsW n=1 Tax=Culicoidibacter larvae TaxID=2579976 RepID=A0A5R8QA67_9FIRM|nr:FtsW/RodA/SpoVE family cell cycle protein [Culicoidibacter larvae]TLG72539.1 FtsW/RodA/SpoVE family cell cycle protein [Culicoidibacter larvae]
MEQTMKQNAKPKAARKNRISLVRRMDWPLFFAMTFLLVFGVIMVYSASMYNALNLYGESPDYFFLRQLIFVIVGFIGFFLVIRINYKLYKKHYILIAVLVTLLLLVTFLFEAKKGSQRWIPLGLFDLQPAELAKIAIIFVWAATYAIKEKYLNKLAKRKMAIQERAKQMFLNVYMIPIGFTLLYMIIMFIQSDNGSMIITLFLSGIITLVAGFNRKISLSVSLIGVCIAVFAVFLLFLMFDHATIDSGNYVVGRFTAWVNPFEDYNDNGYQLVNSYIALAFGGLFGDGLGAGLQKQGYLPDIHTDFILANVGEELGYLGLILVFAFFCLIIWRGVKIATECKDKFGKLTAFGITSLFFVQAFWNAAGITGVLPLKGLTAPLVSYGGTALLVMMGALAILQSIAIRSKIAQEKEAKAMARREKEMEARAAQLAAEPV